MTGVEDLAPSESSEITVDVGFEGNGETALSRGGGLGPRLYSGGIKGTLGRGDWSVDFERVIGVIEDRGSRVESSFFDIGRGRRFRTYRRGAFVQSRSSLGRRKGWK